MSGIVGTLRAASERHEQSGRSTLRPYNASAFDFNVEFAITRQCRDASVRLVVSFSDAARSVPTTLSLTRSLPFSV